MIFFKVFIAMVAVLSVIAFIAVGFKTLVDWVAIKFGNNAAQLLFFIGYPSFVVSLLFYVLSL